METLYPASYVTNLDWLWQGNKSNSRWTKEENKRFESALAIYDEKTPDRWFKVAAMTGKSVYDVINQYQELEADVSDIEAGLVPIPGYFASSLAFELVNNRGFGSFRKRGRSSDQERRRGVPWTEEEHRRFLMGLEKHGKGDWRNISRNYVISKTPTQVASHAQKYYLRQLSGGKDKRRPSIHDITTVHLKDSTALNNKRFVRKEKCPDELKMEQNSADLPRTVIDWKDTNVGSFMVFNSTHGATPCTASYQCNVASGQYGADTSSFLSPDFQIQSRRHQVQGL